MKIKTRDLAGPALDWAVAIIEFPKGAYGGEADHYSGNNNERWVRIPDKKNRCYTLARYSADWAQGGLIIEREQITLRTNACATGHWAAFIDFGNSNCNVKARQSGPTPLIAAMRCYVASKMGDEVDVPDELVSTNS